MLIDFRTDQEREQALRLLMAIDMLRGRGPGYNPPVTRSTQWVKTLWANPQYL
jgi:hypothetical protein